MAISWLCRHCESIICTYPDLSSIWPYRGCGAHILFDIHDMGLLVDDSIYSILNMLLILDLNSLEGLQRGQAVQVAPTLGQSSSNHVTGQAVKDCRDTHKKLWIRSVQLVTPCGCYQIQVAFVESIKMYFWILKLMYIFLCRLASNVYTHYSYAAYCAPILIKLVIVIQMRCEVSGTKKTWR